MIKLNTKVQYYLGWPEHGMDLYSVRSITNLRIIERNDNHQSVGLSPLWNRSIYLMHRDITRRITQVFIEISR